MAEGNVCETFIYIRMLLLAHGKRKA